MLKQQIEAAAKKAFLEMYEKHDAENIYSFALYNDEGVMTVEVHWKLKNSIKKDIFLIFHRFRL